MAVDERHRHRLHEAAREALGDDAAVTLMEMLPPVGWADVATKRDLDELRTGLRTEFRADLATLDRDLTHAMSRLSNRLIVWFVGTGVAVVGATGILRFA